MHPSNFCQEAKRAIQAGIQRGDPISNLEWVGLPRRVLQQLADDDLVYLIDLLTKPPEYLLQMEAFGPKSLNAIYKALSRYHELGTTEEEEEKHIDQDMLRRINVLRTT
jgi:DNA-directed RNA polymerase alpha subunit